jgi:serine/threonine-protein kinase
VIVPRLVGLPAAAALKRLKQVGLIGTTHNVFSKKPRAQVVAQAPRASQKVAKGETVTLNVSKGPKTAPVPDVVGQTAADALSMLRTQGFKTRIVRVPSAEPTGQVVAQHPQAGVRGQPGAVVRLNVSEKAVSTAPSSTPETTVPAATTQDTVPTTTVAAATPSALVRVPDLKGKKLIEARKLLRKVGLIVEIRRVPNAQPLGTVVAQAKKPGTHLKKGTHLLVTVSMGRQESSSSSAPSASGAQPVSVPDVTGEDETTATQNLQSAGLTVHVVDRDTTDVSQDGLVVEQTPTANESVQPNSTVTIYVGRYTGG